MPTHSSRVSDTPASLVAALRSYRTTMLEDSQGLSPVSNGLVVGAAQFREEFGGLTERLVRVACRVPPHGGAPDEDFAKLAGELRGIFLSTSERAKPVADDPDALLVALIPVKFAMGDRIERLSGLLGLQSDLDAEAPSEPAAPGPGRR